MLVALSGGPDSTALLLLLHDLAPSHGWRVVAAHFDHGIRPGGRERARRLRARAAEIGVPLLVGRPTGALRPVHAELRRARYAWLRRAAHRAGAERIATGHQRDDQAETVLFRILRGTGNRGLAGIPERRGPYVRPLLGVGRDEILRWLTVRLDAPLDAPFDDPSNRDPRFARTRLRHALLPALEDAAGPDVAGRLTAVSDAARELRRAVRPVARRVLAAMEDGTAADWPRELRAEALRLATRRHGVRLRGSAARRAAADMVDLSSGQGIDLGGGLRLERTFDTWTIRRHAAAPPPDVALRVPSREPGAGGVVLAGRRYDVRWRPGPFAPDADRDGANRGAAADARGGTRVALRVSGDHFPLVVRGRVHGDRIRLPGGRRKLARLMAEARIPLHERDAVPVVVDRSGHVLCAMTPPLAARIDRDASADENFMIEVREVTQVAEANDG